jgi:hypothetical protein
MIDELVKKYPKTILNLIQLINKKKKDLNDSVTSQNSESDKSLSSVKIVDKSETRPTNKIQMNVDKLIKLLKHKNKLLEAKEANLNEREYKVKHMEKEAIELRNSINNLTSEKEKLESIVSKLRHENVNYLDSFNGITINMDDFQDTDTSTDTDTSILSKIFKL